MFGDTHPPISLQQHSHCPWEQSHWAGRAQALRMLPGLAGPRANPWGGSSSKTRALIAEGLMVLVSHWTPPEAAHMRSCRDMRGAQLQDTVTGLTLMPALFPCRDSPTWTTALTEMKMMALCCFRWFSTSQCSLWGSH